jgi:predicted ABC-type sugar transport system permease subunit
VAVSAAAERQTDEAAPGWLRLVAAAWPWLFLTALLIFFESWARAAYGISFLFNGFNIQSIAMAAAAPLLLGLGQTFVIILGGIDLSVGFVMGLCAVIMARVMQSLAGVPPGLALGAGLAAALLISLVPGLINGFLIARLRVPAFIGTLGMFGVARGAGFLAAGGTTVPVNNPWLFEMGSANLFGVPIPIVLTIVVVLALHYVLSQTRFGQYTYAIGGNRMAALRSGIHVRRHTMMIYLISAGCAAAARFDRRGGDRRRQPVRRLGHGHRHRDRRPDHRRDPVWPGLHRRRAVLAIRRGRRGDHRLGAGRSVAEPPQGRGSG